jgi:CheY-like chemotaxis protein
MTVLIVADVAPIVYRLEHFLSRQGLHVVSAGSARSALAMLRQDTSISIVVWDLGLRGHDGLAGLAAVRQISHFADADVAAPPEIIFLAAPSGEIKTASELELRQEAEDLAPGNVLTKPIDNDELLRRIQSLVQAGGVSVTAGSRAGDAHQGEKPVAVRQLAEEHAWLRSELSRLDVRHKELWSQLGRIEQRMHELQQRA